MIERWKQRARQLKQEVYAFYLAYRDPRVPWYARLVAGLVVAYAFSPLDLIDPSRSWATSTTSCSSPGHRDHDQAPAARRLA